LTKVSQPMQLVVNLANLSNSTHILLWLIQIIVTSL
jgi:hypothetical protein